MSVIVKKKQRMSDAEQPTETELHSICWTISRLADALANAQKYCDEHKHHTSLIIIQGLVSELRPSAESVLTRYAKFTRAQKDKLRTLLHHVKPLLHQRFHRVADTAAARQTEVDFDAFLNEWNFDNCTCANEDESDDTECSCDDCHNRTCSTYGPLGGCRIARTRD